MVFNQARKLVNACSYAGFLTLAPDSQYINQFMYINTIIMYIEFILEAKARPGVHQGLYAIKTQKNYDDSQVCCLQSKVMGLILFWSIFKTTQSNL